MRPAEMKVVHFLLVVSLVLFILQTPLSICRIHLEMRQMNVDGWTPTESDFITQRVLEFIYAMNFSSNFFIYMVAGSNVRRELMRLCGCGVRTDASEPRTNGHGHTALRAEVNGESKCESVTMELTNLPTQTEILSEN